MKKPSFKQVYDLLMLKGPGRTESSRGTIYQVKALKGNIVAFPKSGRVIIHEDCWGANFTCRGTRAGGVLMALIVFMIGIMII